MLTNPEPRIPLLSYLRYHRFTGVAPMISMAHMAQDCLPKIPR